MGTGREQFVLPIEMVVETMNEVFSGGGSFSLTVTGTSMSPTLQPGRDRVSLVSAQSRKFKKNDIVFARRQNGGYALHRVIKVHPNGGCTLNGDGQVWTEEIYPGDVLGVVESICRKGKWISCENGLYRLYVRLWALTRPFRKLLVELKKKLVGKGRNGR